MRVARPLRMAAKSVFAAADVFFPRLVGPRILIYHQVEVGLGREMEVSLDVFRRQLDWLAGNGDVVDLETALCRRGEPNSDRLFVLTFDDGYEDVYRHAYPLLRDRGMSFTVYLTTHPVESREPLAPGATPLTWAQLEEMMGSGLMTVGAHTHRHADLRKLDVNAINEELSSSDDLIERRLGVRPRHFAYPWGLWSDGAETLVSARYASAALSITDSLIESTSLDRLPRIPIQASDRVVFFRQKTQRGMRAEELVRQRVKRYEPPPLEGS